MRKLLTFVCNLLLRIFFRRIEVIGHHHVPSTGGVVFALNHPSGLLDPLFVLCLSGRRVSFLAKAPLFGMPFIGTFVKAFECLPVYRSQDGNDPAKNQEMMRRAEQLLAKGNAIAIFPEATTHDDPTLKPFRSGAARIALSARALGQTPVCIVPGALFYEQKQTFRSRAVLAFGPALALPKIQLDPSGNPDAATTKACTNDIETAVRAILPVAQTPQALVLAENAERLFAAAARDTPEQCPLAVGLMALPSKPALSDRMATRKRILAGYRHLVEVSPARVSQLVANIEELSAELEAAGLPVDARPHSSSPLNLIRLRRVLLVTLFSPFSLLGTLLHLPAYQLVRYIAFRYSGNEIAVVATTKVIAGMLLFPLTWILGALALVALSGHFAWLLSALLGPVLGWMTLTAYDAWGWLIHHFKVVRKTRRAKLKWDGIVARRAQIAEQMAGLLAAQQGDLPSPSAPVQGQKTAHSPLA